MFLDCTDNRESWHTRVNDFVFKVICRYSLALRETIGEASPLDTGGRNVLPIGFLPSSILANWVLTAFDDAIIGQWNPVYYGRYVDDIIIVDKVEKNDPLYKKAHQKVSAECLRADDVIQKKLVEKGIFEADEATSIVYRTRADVLRCKGSIIQVQSKKVRLFYFQSGSTRALLECFKTKIVQNASEFRLFPDMDAVLKYHNYSEIFDLRSEESINKFRGITGIELDKFALAKFLGKYRKVSGMIESREENQSEKDLMLILDERTLISNYGAWESLFEILILNNRCDLYMKLAMRIVKALKEYQVPEGMCRTGTKTHDALLRVLLSALQRTAAVVWGGEFDQRLETLCETVDILRGDERFGPAILAGFDASAMKSARRAYCETRIVNKYLLPIPIDCVLNGLVDDSEIHFGRLEEMLNMLDTSWLRDNVGYTYYPYMVTPQELSFVLICEMLKENKADFNPAVQQELVGRCFARKNYPWSDWDGRNVSYLEQVQCGAMVSTKRLEADGLTIIKATSKKYNRRLESERKPVNTLVMEITWKD